VNDQEFEDWRNRQLSWALNQIETNTRWEGAWNIGTGFLTSAQTAKSRLRHVVGQDRKACGDGKWVKRWGRQFWLIPWNLRDTNNPIIEECVQHWKRQDKARYRWQWRH
jgi:hypothetical protein